MKKGLLLLFTVLVAFTVFGCTNSTTEASIKIGLIVSAAGANDNGYNEFAINGLNQAAEDFNIDINVVSTADDVPGSLEALGEEGYNIVFSLEYNFDALITDDGSGKSIAEKYPDTMFVVFNALANTNTTGAKVHDNVIEVLFNVNESSFLAGALAVLVNESNDVLFTDSAYNFTPTSEARALGFVGGTQSSGITVFGYGFAEGANYIANQMDVNYNLYETYAAGFGASQANYTTIDSYFTSGVNVVFSAAGGVSTNMKNAAAANGKLSIDVDANQDNSVPGSVLTSVLKNTNVAVYDIISKYISNTLVGGVDVYYDLNSGATGITDLATISGFVSTSDAAQLRWNEIKAQIETIRAQISNGTIDVIDAQAGEVLDFATLTHITKVN